MSVSTNYFEILQVSGHSKISNPHQKLASIHPCIEKITMNIWKNHSLIMLFHFPSFSFELKCKGFPFSFSFQFSQQEKSTKLFWEYRHWKGVEDIYIYIDMYSTFFYEMIKWKWGAQQVNRVFPFKLRFYGTCSAVYLIYM